MDIYLYLPVRGTHLSLKDHNLGDVYKNVSVSKSFFHFLPKGLASRVKLLLELKYLELGELG